MDETDLARHSFREGIDTEGRSLQDFADDQEDIYAHYKKQSGFDAASDKLRAEADETKEKFEKL